jgi:hypothetical protein
VVSRAARAASGGICAVCASDGVVELTAMTYLDFGPTSRFVGFKHADGERVALGPSFLIAPDSFRFLHTVPILKNVFDFHNQAAMSHDG